MMESMMSSFQKKICALLCVLLAAVLTLDVALWRAFFVNPDHFRVNYRVVSSEKIPDSMNQVSMVYISDLEYGAFSDPSLTSRIFEKIADLSPDLFVFGGDLFASDYTVSDADRDQMTAWLSSIEAPLGKFAVWGEQDLTNEGRIQNVLDIYSASEIEILDNASRTIGNQSRDGIRLSAFGLDFDPGSALENFSAEQFCMIVSHYPDYLLEDAVQSAPVDFALAGNAHGTQITWPVKGGYRLWPGSEVLNRASHRDLPFNCYLTSGIGCINVKARLNAPVEIVYLTLTNQ